MSEVKRYHVTDSGLVEGQALGRINVVLDVDHDRATAERDAERRRADVAVADANAADAAGKKVSELLSNRTAERDALQALLTAADERAGALETEVARLNRVKLSLKDLAESRADNCSVYRKHLNEALTMAEKVRDASLGMQRKYLADLIDYLHQNGVALKPAEGRGDE